MSITTTDLVRQLEPPSPVFYQARAGLLLEERLEWARESVGSDLVVDAIDSTSYSVLIRAGALLGYLDLLRRAEAAGIEPQALDVTGPAPVVQAACRLLGEATGSRWSIAPQRPTHVDRARRDLHLVRRHLEESVRGSRPVSAHEAEVLLVAHQPGHLADLTGVHAALSERGIRAVVVTDDTRVEGQAAEVLPVLRLPSSRREWARATATTAGVIGRLRRSRRSRREQGRDDARRGFDEVLGRCLAAELPRSIVAARGLRRLSEVLGQPATLSVNPYASTGRLALLRARRADQVTMAIQHGSVFWGDPRWRDCAATDLVCVWGDWSRDALEAAGVGQDSLVVTGVPRYDNISAPERSASRSVQPTVLVAVSGAGDHVSAEQHQLFIDLLCRAAEATPHVRWLVKLHPKDRVELYHGRGPGSDRLEVIAPGQDKLSGGVVRYLADADVLVTVSSTTALDALGVGVPVVQVRAVGDDDSPDFVADVAAESVDTWDGLVAAVERQLAAPGVAAADARPRHLANPGTATAATADAIERTLRSRDVASQHG